MYIWACGFDASLCHCNREKEKTGQPTLSLLQWQGQLPQITQMDNWTGEKQAFTEYCCLDPSSLCYFYPHSTSQCFVLLNVSCGTIIYYAGHVFISWTLFSVNPSTETLVTELQTTPCRTQELPVQSSGPPRTRIGPSQPCPTPRQQPWCQS